MVLVTLLATSALARTGGIEASSCVGCHGSGNQQTELTLTPATFNPGDTITVRVRISGSGSVGGVALSSGGVGTFTLISGQGTRLSNGIVLHSAAKAASSGAVTFEARWTAPSTMGGVTFDAATLLGNGDRARTGDQGGGASLSEAFGCAGITYFADLDGDGIGSRTSGTTKNCMTPVGFSATDGDCDDFDNRKTPGKAEACNGLDDDCDGQVDEGLTTMTTWPDVDGDGFGAMSGAPMSGCGGGNRAPNNADCDDAVRTTFPGAAETCNMRDDDCDGQVDEGAKIRCGEGWCARLGPTCNPAHCTPGQPMAERCNALDDDCDGLVDDGDLCGQGFICELGQCVEEEVEIITPDAGSGGGGNFGETTCSTSAAGPLALAVLAACRGLHRCGSSRRQR